MSRDTVIFIAGCRWNDVAGTDKSLATALSRFVDVLWVDPPFSLLTKVSGHGNGVDGVSQEAPRVWRLQVRTVPGASMRASLGFLAEQQVSMRLARELRRSDRRVLATIVASPRATFPRSVDGAKILYATDDWLEGASLMSLDRKRVEQTLVRNLRACDIAYGVSAGVVEMLANLSVPGRVEILANGCDEFDSLPYVVSETPTAGLIGQLNERLDFDVLDSVARSGTALLIIGPRTERDAEVGKRLDHLLTLPNVTWLGRLPQEQLRKHLARMTVGLTPYRNTPFNRASFPLKTLEYLAAGLPVVSTDLPAARWLNTPDIRVSSTVEEFTRQVSDVLREMPDEAARNRRSEFARNHTWGARADQLMEALRELSVPTAA
ncbi:teichuronic acid biosynthesis glycosyltransferase TuaH [Okibacterium sp. HSC-33S16]|uniref:glycosyltransferase n=1 Tax=Okibacterium sp. HSC-33S16 TaxID=2910965 RepID=UPI0020A01CB7|nr:glycosyltransferase [Okibacterium sp. HSC-33S16]MCP2031552.1 teichuronic acid biosynthesis glycosyltransferase TuaH [Okibacterium sp. HSC-33S16]